MIEPGMLAASKAGHDKGTVYVIIDVKNEYIYLADGKTRTICQAKKKNRKHIQVICEKHDISAARDADIRSILKQYKDEMKSVQ